MRKYWGKAVAFLILSIFLEVVVFNCRALFSLTSTNQHLEYTREGNTLYLAGMDGEPGYLYLGISSYTETGDQVPVTVTLCLQDEGNSEYYELSEAAIYPPVEKSKYLRVYSYGAVEGMQIVLEAGTTADIRVTDVIYDAKVPWFVSGVRILAVFGVLCLIWCLRPASAIYKWNWTKRQKLLSASIILFTNVVLFLILVRSNPAFLNPVWPYHEQYYELAVSLSQGKVSIDVGNEEMLSALSSLENPYDSSLRQQVVPNAGNVWDICYFRGKFYVYFGIVPVLIFYLPYYLLFQGAFPTWLGVFLAGTGILGGVYYLLGQIRKRWFPKTPYICYLLISVIGGNSLNLYSALLHADFYCLPILLALCFSLCGLGLMVSVSAEWADKKKGVSIKLAGGALCLALTAGCRPQFLVGSFLLIPILGPLFWQGRKEKQTWLRFFALVLPYMVVALGLMFYNQIRFGSVFDFGANYNLTTNDMTRRGMNLGRLPDGIFMYLFQPISLKLSFPFAEVTAFYSDYLGATVKDWTYGGAFWTRPILLAVFAVGVLRKELKQKKLYGVTLLSIGLALVVVLADTEMAGILNRYYTDFLWLLVVAAAIVLLQLLEKHQNTAGFRWIILFLLAAGAWSMFYDMAIAFRGSGLMNDNVHRYYMIKSFFQ